jgi:hypothetical protein
MEFGPKSTMPDMPDFSVDSLASVYVRAADWIESRIKSGEAWFPLAPKREPAATAKVPTTTARPPQYCSANAA